MKMIVEIASVLMMDVVYFRKHIIMGNRNTNYESLRPTKAVTTCKFNFRIFYRKNILYYFI